MIPLRIALRLKHERLLTAAFIDKDGRFPFLAERQDITAEAEVLAVANYDALMADNRPDNTPPAAPGAAMHAQAAHDATMVIANKPRPNVTLRAAASGQTSVLARGLMAPRGVDFGRALRTTPRPGSRSRCRSPCRIPTRTPSCRPSGAREGGS